MGVFELRPEVGTSRPGRLAQGLEDRTYFIGSISDCDLVCDHKDVSGKHAKIEVARQTISITDLSRLGTWVNGFKLESGSKGKIPLLHGDRINLGSKNQVLVLDSPDTIRRLASPSLPIVWSEPAPELTLYADDRTFEIKNIPWLYMQSMFKGKWTTISGRQFDVLALLYSRRGKVCRYEEIQREIDTQGGRGFPSMNDSRIRDENLLNLDHFQRQRIRNLVSEIRHLIGIHRPNFLIRNVQDVGYMMAESGFLEDPPFNRKTD